MHAIVQNVYKDYFESLQLINASEEVVTMSELEVVALTEVKDSSTTINSTMALTATEDLATTPQAMRVSSPDLIDVSDIPNSSPSRCDANEHPMIRFRTHEVNSIFISDFYFV